MSIFGKDETTPETGGVLQAFAEVIQRKATEAADAALAKASAAVDDLRRRADAALKRANEASARVEAVAGLAEHLQATATDTVLPRGADRTFITSVEVHPGYQWSDSEVRIRGCGVRLLPLASQNEEMKESAVYTVVVSIFKQGAR